jgi:proteasome accessory factor B
MLGHNVVALSVEDVFNRAEKKLTAKERDLLRELPRKFFTAPWAPKDYSDKVDILEDVIKAVVYQNLIKIFYNKPGEKEPWHYTLEPWTLLYHKGGFYLVARSVRQARPVYFNLERIQSVTLTKDKFDYPKNYHPSQMLDGAFGIFSGPAQTFKLKFSPKVSEYVTARKWHRSQKIQRKRDGSLVLTLKVADSEEVRSWIRSFGKEVKVLKP